MNEPALQIRREDCIVVVPCFNEAMRLDVRTYGKFLEGTSNVSLLLVDDGSTDDTPLILEQLRQLYPRQVCTLRLASNVGKAEAVRRGMRAALRRQPKFVGYWDADLATPLDAVLQFRELLQTRPERLLVMGSRVCLLGRQIRRSRVRHFMGRTFATAASIVLGLPVYDTQCGAKLFRATPFLGELISKPFQSRWVFDVEILARITAALPTVGTPSACDAIYEYPLNQWQDVRGSRLAPLDFLIAAIDLAEIFWRYRQRGSRTETLPSASRIQHPGSDIPKRDAA